MHFLGQFLFLFFISMPVLFGWSKSATVVKTISVNWRGGADFTTIQAAIDSIPLNNQQWILISVKKGVYMEQITVNKSYIVLEGEGQQNTVIDWGYAQNTLASSTFSLEADNFVAKKIAFKNNYNHPPEMMSPVKQAVAARVAGNNAAFYSCSFLSVQDTMWDARGRHYFYSCYFEGAVDFIFGQGQSHYENCILEVFSVDPNQRNGGFITAHGRETANDPSGFVFKNCIVSGTGSVFLGRAWRPYARVLFYQSNFTGIVNPLGWDAWNYKGHEGTITFAESGCYGRGSDTSKRVSWEKRLNKEELQSLISRSFIDSDGWIENQP